MGCRGGVPRKLLRNNERLGVEGVRSAGSSTRRATYFLLLRQKKVGKEKAAPLAVSLRFATGNLRCSVMGRRCGTRCAAAPLRSDNRSESEHEAWASFGAHARPKPCASRHGQRGAEFKRAIASLGPGLLTLPLAGEG